ncbi:hypothetical protein ACHAXT_001441 [Thalassiosira profunda]
MASLGRAGALAPKRRRLRCNSLRVPRCILSLVLLLCCGSTSAFQLQPTAGPARRTIALSESSSDDLDSRPLFASASSSGGDTDTTQTAISESAQFGESVPLRSRPATTNNGEAVLFSKGGIDERELLKQNRTRNIAVAVASFAFAIFNYGWQVAHPVSAVEILASMEKQSAPLAAIGNNGKPTVVDFWAPWCENCKVEAPTLQAVEQEYADRVNFIMVNGDDGRNWPLIQLFGVDAIPHMALVSSEGDVETAMIGITPRNVLRADIDALLNKREECEEVVEVQPVCHDAHEDLPYKMYDAFGNRSNRRINFVEAMKEGDRISS